MRAVLPATHYGQHRLLFELFYASGMRIGETVGLTLGDLTSKDAVIEVIYQLGRDRIRTQRTNSESRRAIDISRQLMKRLLALAGDHGSLFTPAGSRRQRPRMQDLPRCLPTAPA